MQYIKKSLILGLVFMLILSNITYAISSFRIDGELSMQVISKYTQAQKGFVDILGVENKDKSNLIGTKLKYEMNIKYTSGNSNFVELIGKFKINNKNADFNVKGIVDRVTVANKYTLTSGPLDGEIKIDGRIYKTIVGFEKLSNSDDIFLTMTISYENNLGYSLLTFGKPVLTKAMYEEIKANKEKNHLAEKKEDISDNQKNAAITARTIPDYGDDFERVSFETARLEEHKSITGVMVGLLKSDPRKDTTLQLKVFSYLDDLERELSTPYNLSMEVSQIIAGIDVGDYGHCDGTRPSDKDETWTEHLLFNILEDVLGYYGVPTSVISEICNGASGRVLVAYDMKAPAIRVKTAIGDSLNIDYEGFPLFFGFSTGSSKRVNGNYYATVRYRIVDSYPQVGTVTYYLDSEDAIEDFDVTF
ncbi:hypothetical protein [Brassicibacter mesophilus]|uniref:hypothetical protein n=1 Tax=Brassicibacter mesophilus TaxID=745119 RepID=UPI003D1CD318